MMMKIIAISAFLMISCHLRSQNFYFSEINTPNIAVSKICNLFSRELRLVTDLTELSASDVELSSNEVKLKKVYDSVYILTYSKCTLSNVKILVRSKKMNKIVDTINLKTDFCYVTFDHEFVPTSTRNNESLDFKWFRVEIENLGHAAENVAILEFTLSVEDSTGKILFSEKVERPSIPAPIISRLKSVYREGLLIKLKSILMQNESNLIILPEYIYRYPKYLADDKNILLYNSHNRRQSKKIKLVSILH